MNERWQTFSTFFNAVGTEPKYGNFISLLWYFCWLKMIKKWKNMYSPKSHKFSVYFEILFATFYMYVQLYIIESYPHRNKFLDMACISIYLSCHLSSMKVIKNAIVLYRLYILKLVCFLYCEWIATIKEQIKNFWSCVGTYFSWLPLIMIMIEIFFVFISLK